MRIFWSFISAVITGLVFIILSPKIQLKLGVENFSLFTFFISFATIVCILDFGLSKGICFINAKLMNTFEQKYLFSVQKKIVLLNIFSSLITILIVAPFVFHAYHFKSSFLQLFLISLCLSFFCVNNTLKASYEGENKFFKSCLIRVFAVISLWLPSIILKQDEWQKTSGLALTSALLSLPIAIKILSKKNYLKNSNKDYKIIFDQKSFFLYSFLSSICIVLTNYIDRLILFYLSKPLDFSVYFILSEFFLKLLIPSTILSSLLYRDIIYHHARNQIKRVHSVIAKTCLISFLVPLIALLAVYYFKTNIFCNYFDIKKDLSLLIIIFGAGITLNSIAAIFSTSLEALGFQKERLQIFIISAPLNCILCFILVIKMGLVGAVIYWLLKSLVELVLFSFCLLSKLKFLCSLSN